MKDTKKEKKKIKIDAKGKVLGRISTEIANTLRGKNTTSFAPNKSPELEVVVFNTDLLKITGNKINNKIYYKHSGYPGGIKEQKLKNLIIEDSREVLRRSVHGMLPKNKLRNVFMKNLILYRKDID